MPAGYNENRTNVLRFLNKRESEKSTNSHYPVQAGVLYSKLSLHKRTEVHSAHREEEVKIAFFICRDKERGSVLSDVHVVLECFGIVLSRMTPSKGHCCLHHRRQLRTDYSLLNASAAGGVNTDHRRARKHVLETGQCACGLNQRHTSAGAHYSIVHTLHTNRPGVQIRHRSAHLTRRAFCTDNLLNNM